MKLYRLPRALPPVQVLLADLEHPTGADLAAALGVSVRSVWRWQQADTWPRAQHLCLFYASRYGWTLIQSEALYAIDMAAGLARALREERDTLRAQLEHVQALAGTGAANAAVLLPGVDRRAGAAARPRRAPLPRDPVPQRR